jgi:hypothetical protein
MFVVPTVPVATKLVVKVTVASASTVAVPNEAVALTPTTLNLLTVLVVAVPNALVPAKPVVIIIVASASTNTETLPKVATCELGIETFASELQVLLYLKQKFQPDLLELCSLYQLHWL